MSIDDPTTNRLYCDIVFYPPSPQVLMEYEFRGNKKHGWQWVPLKSNSYFNVDKGEKSLIKGLRKISLLVSMGGSDPHGLIF